MNVLETRALSKKFRGAPGYALRDVGLAAAEAEVLAVVGESGCGKTTLLRLIAGLEVPTSGEVLLNGDVASTAHAVVPPEQRSVGLVFQEYALFPHLTVLENVTFGLHALHRTARRNRGVDTLGLVGLEEYATRYPHELSGGQQQRVALARALAPRPRLLLLDEPFSNLDVVSKVQVRDEVGQIIRSTGTTALFVVHDLEDVLAVADRIAILKQGALQQLDTPQRVYLTPVDEYVARLFGATNVLPARPRDDGFDTPIGFIASEAARGRHGPVMLSIRPEDIEIAPPDAAGTPATVRRTRFRGDHVEVVLVLAGGTHEVVLHARPGSAIGIGDDVTVRSAAGEVRVVGGE